MLKLMLIQRGGATMHKIMDSDTRFHDFIEMVTFDNFEHTKGMTWDEASKTVQVPYSGTTYTMLEMPEIVSAVTYGLN